MVWRSSHGGRRPETSGLAVKRPFLIGLTGSIGMGKSTTAEMFEAEGVPVWSADEAVHRLYSADGEAVSAIASLCPDAVTDQGVDRGILSKWIAEAPNGLSRIEALVHPMVAADRERFLKDTLSDLIVLDIPLLFETGADARVDAVVVVSAPEEEQRRRVLERPGMTTEKLEMILSKQLFDAEKRRRADYVIWTTSLDEARTAVQKVIRDIRSRRRNA